MACTWSSAGSSPCRALHAWLVSHGWVFQQEWIWHHVLSGNILDLSVASNPGTGLHIVPDAWRAWCLHRHTASSRRDADVDGFADPGYYFARLVGLPLGSLLLLALVPVH